MKKALLVMDYIKEIVSPKGKFKVKGYADFVNERDTIATINEATEKFRKDGEVVHIKVGFKPDYSNWPSNSVLFGKAKEYGALKLDSWATEFHKDITIETGDAVFVKSRISPFYKTGLHSYLQKRGVKDVYLAGVATDLVVQSASRDAHDRDYNVFVVEDLCAAGSVEDHQNSLETMKKYAKIISSKEL